MTYLAPSILAADLLQLEAQINEVEASGADYMHIDVMDGQFVPNISFGPVMVESVKRISNLPADVHLMIETPQNYIKSFAMAGADIITIHQEACPHLDRALNLIKENGVKAGVALNPATNIDTIESILGIVDLVLVMTVNPGFGGQKFISYTLDKVKKLSQIKKKQDFTFQIEVDGGINNETAALAFKAGAEIFVAGNAIFKAPSIASACKTLKQTIRLNDGIHSA